MLELLIICAVISLYIFFKKINDYWGKQQVSHIRPNPIVGNIGPFVFGKLSLAELIQKFYESFPGKRFVGIHSFIQPVLVINDVDLIKQIAIKDFDHFVDRRTFVSEEVDPLFGKSLFSLTGQRWKNMRSTLSPAFSSGKMKIIFTLISEMAEQFNNHLIRKIESNNIVTLEMKDLFTRFANDVIATSAFGIQCDSLENRNNEFFIMGQRTTFDGFIDSIKLFGYSLSPAIMKFFSVKLFSNTVSNFFRDIVLSTIKVREEKGIVRPDMIHLMMEARKEKANDTDGEKSDLSDDDIASQALFFFFAGFETTSTLLCHMANELALNVEIQTKLQKEIDEVIEKHGEKVSYETLMEMKYLDMVINETLRKWPTVPVVDRNCVKTYTIDPINTVENPVTIEKGQNVWFPIFGLHRDPKYFPDPEKFDPERFNSENKSNIKQFSYLPFGIGPRNCIGARFALLETKIVYFNLLSKFDLLVVEKTQIPLKLKKFQFNIHAEKGFWIGFKRRHSSQ